MTQAARIATEVLAPFHDAVLSTSGRTDAPQRELHEGFRLERLEVYNWGTFDRHVWQLAPSGDNSLLTGDIGSGKSTLVDALTTLLVPPLRLVYNKAAGAEAKERTLRSYTLGQYRSERGDSGSSAKPVALRDHSSHSVIAARFRNARLNLDVTLAQVFWWKEPSGQPSRLFVVAATPLTIGGQFADFGADIATLRKRLRALPATELFDTFPPYAAAFRRRLGIDNEQAMDLFYQTVSMKSVGNLTDFVREHMLEAPAIEERISHLLAHFADLTRAHEAVLKAKRQIDLLAPLVTNCDEHARTLAEAHDLAACRDALRAWFASLQWDLLVDYLGSIEADLRVAAETRAELSARHATQQTSIDSINRAIRANGGDRIAEIRERVAELTKERDRRHERASRYDELCNALNLPRLTDAASFVATQHRLSDRRTDIQNRQADFQNSLTEATVVMRQLKEEYDTVAKELASLRQRKSNIPSYMLDIRRNLCNALEIQPDDVPFAGELIQIRPEAPEWEGVAERLLHQFAQSLLVADADYSKVASWVDRTNLRGRLVYYRIRDRHAHRRKLESTSLVHKLAVQPASPFYAWLDAELSMRFDFTCCTSIDDFRRAEKAVTRTGQIKWGGDRHEKDDRHPLNDRTRYVLGWSNEGKISALERGLADVEQQGTAAHRRLGELDGQRNSLQKEWGKLEQLSVYDSFAELDWQPVAIAIQQLTGERERLEKASNVLETLGEQLAAAEGARDATGKDLETTTLHVGALTNRQENAERLVTECETTALDTSDAVRNLFPRLAGMRQDALGTREVTVESCDRRQQEMRDWLQKRIDERNDAALKLTQRIVADMRAYKGDYPQETRDTDASLAAGPEFAEMLEKLVADDLPRFEARFKELLNENTIREVANFQSQLSRERRDIVERLERINKSLRSIDFNPARFIILEAELTTDVEIRDFQLQLRACTEGTLTGSDSEAYSEAKFLQVQRIIERFRGRDGTAELDRRWTEKVTDVRNWFVFSASERWREDDSEHEHYTDSGGKSGGQKEKLAYTVLAAALAYQFGLDSPERRTRAFRFVIIDEAFGRGSDESARYGLELFRRLGLQLLIVTPLQKIHIIEPYVASVGFVHNPDGRVSMVRNLTIEEYRTERDAAAGQ